MEQIINQIYWESVANTYMYGTRLKGHADKSVEFENNMMAPGKEIVSWHSTTNYQSTKRVPDLPFLVNGNEYQIFIKADAIPEKTCVNRLTFFDAQKEEIKRLEFTDTRYTFTFPKDAVSYTFSIVNAGCKKINFERIQIADQDLPLKILDDIYFNDVINPESDRTLNLILVMDNIHARKIWSKLKIYAGTLPWVVVNISWQGRQKAGTVIKDWLASHKITNFRLISTNTKLNNLIPDIFINHFNVEYYENNAIRSNNVLMQKDLTWYSESVCDPDWLAISKFLHKECEGIK